MIDLMRRVCSADEFEPLMRWVLVAFELEAEGPLEIEHKVENGNGGPQEGSLSHFFRYRFQGQAFDLSVSRVMGQTQNMLCLSLVERGAGEVRKGQVSFIQNADARGRTQLLEHHQCPAALISRMMLGLSRLGTDVAPLCEEANIDISVHERLEWALQRQEVQRKMRDVEYVRKFAAIRPIPPTRKEFESEVRRIVAAFGLDREGPLEIGYQLQTHQAKDVHVSDIPVDFLYFHYPTDSFLLWGYRWISRTENELNIRVMVAGETDKPIKFFNSKPFLGFTDSPTAQEIYGRQRPSPCDSFLLRGLFNLSYDIDHFSAQLGLTLTAHERLEWELERRELLKEFFP